MIPHILEKIKAHQNDIFWVVFSVLMVLTLVGGGLLYSKTSKKYPIQIQEKAFSVGVGETASSTKGEYVASKNGSKYYTPKCKATNRIAEENRIYFAVAADAEAAGYTLSASCY